LSVVILWSVSTCLTSYTFRAYTVASNNIYEDPDSGAVAWRTGPSGSLFPWPTEPGMLEVLSGVGEVDLFIYRYLIKDWALASLLGLVWILTVLFMLRAIRHAILERFERAKRLQKR